MVRYAIRFDGKLFVFGKPFTGLDNLKGLAISNDGIVDEFSAPPGDPGYVDKVEINDFTDTTSAVLCDATLRVGRKFYDITLMPVQPLDCKGRYEIDKNVILLDEIPDKRLNNYLLRHVSLKRRVVVGKMIIEDFNVAGYEYAIAKGLKLRAIIGIPTDYTVIYDKNRKIILGSEKKWRIIFTTYERKILR